MSVLKSPAEPKIPSERLPDLPSQEDLPVVQRAQANPEPNSVGPESNLFLKGDQNINEPASDDSVKKEQQLPKKKILRSLRNFLYEPTCYSWYREDNNIIYSKKKKNRIWHQK